MRSLYFVRTRHSETATICNSKKAVQMAIAGELNRGHALSAIEVRKAGKKVAIQSAEPTYRANSVQL